MIVRIKLRTGAFAYLAACDLCRRRCAAPESPTARDARRASQAAGWTKHGGIRRCPNCHTTTPATSSTHEGQPT